MVLSEYHSMALYCTIRCDFQLGEIVIKVYVYKLDQCTNGASLYRCGTEDSHRNMTSQSDSDLVSKIKCLRLEAV